MNPSSTDQEGAANLNPFEPCAGLRETSSDVQSANVLIVDDEADVIQALKLRLEMAGYRAITAADGAEALDLLRRTNVDLVLADLMMPNLDGLELTRRVRQDPSRPEVQVMLFSCNEDPVARKLALEFGALDYLSKAIGAREIVSRVEEILKTAKTSEPLKARTGYGLAEADLISQLRAISNGATESIPPREDLERGIGQSTSAGSSSDLLHLATALGEPIESRQSPKRDN